MFCTLLFKEPIFDHIAKNNYIFDLCQTIDIDNMGNV